MLNIGFYLMLIGLMGLQIREEPVFDLPDSDCRDEVLIADIEQAYVYASCTSSGSERIMRVYVVNRAAPTLGLLRELAIGFCGPSVISASGPTGWATRIEGQERHDVTWSLSDALVDRLGIRSGGRAGGFEVHLKPGWKRSRSEGAWWGESNIVAKATTHDCQPPQPPNTRLHPTAAGQFGVR